jgi:hypothetical protein
MLAAARRILVGAVFYLGLPVPVPTPLRRFCVQRVASLQ